MTGIEHFRKGEEILADAERRQGNAGFADLYATNLIALANAHFAAAQVAATVISAEKADAAVVTTSQAAWADVIGEQR